MKHESWRSELLDNGQELPSLFQYTRGLRIESIVIDPLHTGELGITAHVLGNIFQLCINARVFGATVDANVKNLASDLDAWEKREKTPNRFNGKLTNDRICFSNSWPKLHTKGVIARCLVPYALGPREQLVCQLLVRYYTLLASEGQFFSPVAKVEMPELGLHFCRPIKQSCWPSALVLVAAWLRMILDALIGRVACVTSSRASVLTRVATDLLLIATGSSGVPVLGWLLVYIFLYLLFRYRMN